MIDTNLRRNKRFNLLVCQSFLFTYVEQYTIVKVKITTLEYYNIFYIYTFPNIIVIFIQ